MFCKVFHRSRRIGGKTFPFSTARMTVSSFFALRNVPGFRSRSANAAVGILAWRPAENIAGRNLLNLPGYDPTPRRSAGLEATALRQPRWPTLPFHPGFQTLAARLDPSVLPGNFAGASAGAGSLPANCRLAFIRRLISIQGNG
jgi:hypothetical protein